MLPPIDQDILSNNPQFESLYRDLTVNKLNPDGTSKLDAKTQRERNAVAEDLRQARIEDAKRTLIRSGLRETAYRGYELPEELQQNVAVTAALLEGNIVQDDYEIVSADIEDFVQNLPTVATNLSKAYTTQTALLTDLTNPPSPKSRSSPRTDVTALPQTLKNLTIHHEVLHITLQTHHKTLTTTLIPTLHTIHTHLLTTAIALLEQNLHGANFRALKAQTAYLALVAQGMGKKLRLQGRQVEGLLEVGGVRGVLEERVRALEREGRGLRRVVGERERRLEGLRGVGGMREVAGELARVRGEIERVRGEIGRLEGAR